MYILFLLLNLLSFAISFNIDTHSPLFKYGPNGSYFGYSVAQHFSNNVPLILVGAPRSVSRQKDVDHGGALFSCGINTFTEGRGKGCSEVDAEYEDVIGYSKRPDMTAVQGKSLHYLGKNHQLLGASVSSQAINGGGAVVCSPLTRFHNMSSYVQGVCYELDTDLKMKTLYSTCTQKNVEKGERHNQFGACMEGLSVAMTKDTIVTGVIGALKWTGGVFAKWSEGGQFGDTKEKYTMAAGDREGIRSLLTSHDYLGYSVDVGRFGFWYEDKQASQTIVSGATRSGQHGAVLFMPFVKSDISDSLDLTEDKFVLNGTKMGSAFGYSIKVIDINNDGFDDLLVSAPFEHRSDSDGHFGGIVYLYFSQGVRRGKQQSNLVFHPPVVVKKAGHFAQFGLAMASLGNVDGDKEGYRDFAIGAPYDNDGAGSVFIYLGAKGPEQFRRKPAQVIKGQDFKMLNGNPMKTFGFSLSGGMDVDANGYPDLVVGSVARDVVTILRSRPVISISAKHKTPSKYIDIEKGTSCPRGAKTCFPLSLSVFVGDETIKGANLVDFSSDVFTCNLEIRTTPKAAGPRALIGDNHQTNYSWPCGRNSHRSEQTYQRVIYVPDNEASKDWINPLSFRFTVRIKDGRNPPAAIEGQAIVDLKEYPILNKYGASYEFKTPFNTRCGDDQVCQTDLLLTAGFSGIPQTDRGYVLNVGDKENLAIAVQIENKKEKAYQASLYLIFDSEELELPKIPGKQRFSYETLNKNTVVVHLGNPMEAQTKHNFEIRFKLVRGRTEGIGRPLRFVAVVNSTSEEMNEDDNKWEAEVQIIKKAELELIGISEPSLVRYGGDVRGTNDMELEEDIGVMVRHNYTLHNLGPWTVRNVKAEFQWPYQIESASKELWALYLLDVPTVTMHNNDGTTEIRRCSVDRKVEYVNPLDHIRLNTKYSSQETVPRRKEQKRLKRETTLPIAAASFSRDRLAPKKRLENGFDVNVVTISCADKSAKCFTVVCHFDFIDANSAPVVDFRARLWNSTFIKDYYDVEYVEVVSQGQIIVDTNQGIEDDPSNNIAQVMTIAYPDRPAIGDSRPIPWWIFVLSALIGLLILALFVVCLWRCGFFKRKRVREPSLYRAELTHEREQWAMADL